MSEDQFISEFHHSFLGDWRLDQRLNKLAESAKKSPGSSFPKMFETSSELEGAYRFFSNKRVSWSSILKGHLFKSRERVGQCDLALVAHDTTDFVFTSHREREGLGRTFQHSVWTKGFLGHFSLAITADAKKTPLGLVATKFYTRSDSKKPQRRNRTLSNGSQNESYRWIEQAIEVEKHKQPGTKLIHLMDREGDSYELFDNLISNHIGFIIRIHRERRLAQAGEFKRLFDALGSAQAQVTQSVPIARRRSGKSAGEKRRHPQRSARIAKLSIAAKTLTIKRSDGLHENGSPTLTLNFIRVWEADPPLDCEPIEWNLVTTEPIETTSQLQLITEHYRSRWVIEEYFKAIKTGCRFEERQQESYHGLLNVLATFLPVAWWLLALRNLSRAEEPEPSELFISQPQRDLLTAKFPDLKDKLETVRDVLYAIARLGGHIKWNGPPGWQVIYRGYEELRHLEEGYWLTLALIQRDK